MKDYPSNLSELESHFSTETACKSYLFRLRWPNGFKCPRCGHEKYWKTTGQLFRCASCEYKVSITAGTIFEGTHKPLVDWFRAIWWVTSQKNGASAKGLQGILGLGSYKTAWAWLHKLRRAMIRPGRDRLNGLVEVDETLYGGEKPGKRGRGAVGKVLVMIAVEDKGKKEIGRIRLQVVADASAERLNQFVQTTVNKGSTIRTDGWTGYNDLESIGYQHVVANQRAEVGEHPLKLVHLVASLLKRWLLGTHQGAVSHEHLPYYLDEYTFRFNRRKSNSRGLLFYRLLQNAMQREPVTFNDISKSCRGRKLKNS